MGVNLFQYKTKFPFIYSVCVTYPLHRYGRQQLCSWCNAPLAKHLTLLTQPAFECTATDSSCSSQLTLQVTFHRSFPPYYYYDVKLQKNIEICKKFHYIFQAIMVNIGQSRSIMVNIGQYRPTAHQFFVPLQRVRKRKSTS